jgi:hypothetical protein
MTLLQSVPQSFLFIPLLTSTALLFAALILDELLLHFAARIRRTQPRRMGSASPPAGVVQIQSRRSK